MALTLGRSPFGQQTTGLFNFDRPEGKVIYWEDWPKRLRVGMGGMAIVDSRRAKSLHETGHLMRLHVLREDVNMDALIRAEKSTHCPHKGDATYYSVQTDESTIENVAWSYEAPQEHVLFMKDYLSFDLDKVEAWYMEDEKGYAHTRDPYHRVDVHRSSRRVVARLGGEIVAATDSPAILFETSLPPRYYFAPDDVRSDHLEKGEKVSDCPYKGPGQHWHISAGGERVEDACWSPIDPIGDAQTIENWICFYPGKIHTEVDGERLES